MKQTLKTILILTFAIILFYAFGAFFYDKYYDFQLNLISLFSGGKIHFFGKFPFLFFGDPYFRFFTALIPVAVFLTSLISKKISLKFLLASFLIILASVFLCTVIKGYFESLKLANYSSYLANDKNLLFIPLNEVNILKPYFAGIILGTFLSGLVNYRFRRTQL